jgi:hypothetical protein
MNTATRHATPAALYTSAQWLTGIGKALLEEQDHVIPRQGQASRGHAQECDRRRSLNHDPDADYLADLMNTATRHATPAALYTSAQWLPESRVELLCSSSPQDSQHRDRG